MIATISITADAQGSILKSVDAKGFVPGKSAKKSIVILNQGKLGADQIFSSVLQE